jgi:hypothetical protein
MGASTIYADDDTSLGGGVGVMLFAGYQISEHFGVGGFAHYNQATIQFVESDEEPDELSAFVLLGGVEARGGFMTESVDGWASLGLAMGYGKLTYKDTEGSFTSEGDDEVNFGVTPTIAFGAEAKASSLVSIGPIFRLYLTQIGEVCTDQKVEDSGTEVFSDSECGSDTGDAIVPNIAFAGVSLTFRP